jgi:hypothetical protein
METQFTPGPWHVHDNVSYEKIHERNIGTYDIKTTPPGALEDSIWLADVKPYDVSGFTSKETACANAHLIASAPDMFEVIKGLYEYSKKSGVKSYMYEEIEAAYLKATEQAISPIENQ